MNSSQTDWHEKRQDDRKVQNLNCDESFLLSVTRDLSQMAQGQLQQSTTTFIITRFHCTATASNSGYKTGASRRTDCCMEYKGRIQIGIRTRVQTP